MINVIISHLNISSLRNKFESLTAQITGNVDIVMTSKTKLDRSAFGGKMFGARDDIPSKIIAIENSIEAFFAEINLLKKMAALQFKKSVKLIETLKA